jgi:2-oxoglutarate ferredoxin oxidoreductase subunit beta
MHDGSRLLLKKVAEDYDPTRKAQALRLLRDTADRGVFATGILYVEPDRPTFVDLLNLIDEPLATLSADRTRPPRAALEAIMEELR